MNMTKSDAEKIVKESTRCTQATMKAFGIDGYPYYGSGCIAYLIANGFSIKELIECRGMTMNTFLKHIDHDWDCLILTKGHAMAYVDNILIDTMNQDFNKRKIEHIYIVG